MADLLTTDEIRDRVQRLMDQDREKNDDNDQNYNSEVVLKDAPIILQEEEDLIEAVIEIQDDKESNENDENNNGNSILLEDEINEKIDAMRRKQEELELKFSSMSEKIEKSSSYSIDLGACFQRLLDQVNNINTNQEKLVEIVDKSMSINQQHQAADEQENSVNDDFSKQNKNKRRSGTQTSWTRDREMAQYEIYVGDIPVYVSENGIANYFLRYGAIDHVVIVGFQPLRNSKSAIVHFEEISAAKAALSIRNHMAFGHIRLNVRKSFGPHIHDTSARQRNGHCDRKENFRNTFKSIHSRLSGRSNNNRFNPY